MTLLGGLRDRARFWRNAFLRGWRDVVHIKDHAELAAILLAGLLALLGFGTWLNHVGQQAWIAPTAVLGVLVLTVAEGAYAEWKTANERPKHATIARPAIELGDPEPWPNETLDRTGRETVYRNLSASVPEFDHYQETTFSVPVHLYRVPVRNSGAPADSVYVKLTNVSPPLPRGYTGPILHLKGDNDENGRMTSKLSRGFPLPTGGSEEIDVISMETGRTDACYIYSIHSRDMAEEVGALSGRYILTLQAFAGDSPSPPADYEVDVDSRLGKLSMVAVHQGGQDE